MKAAIAQALCWSAYHTGVLHGAMRLAEPRHRRAAGGRFQVLVYHRVADDADPFVSATPVRVFERHMRYVRERFNVLSLTQLLTAAARDEIPARAVAVTFDDGYQDTYSHAYPVVRRYGIPITVYLATAFIDSGQPMWNDRLGAAIRDAAGSELPSVLGNDPLPLQTGAQRLHAFERTRALLKALPPATRDHLVDDLRAALRPRAAGAPGMLTWAHVREMHAGGVEFGAHTVHHPILTALSAQDGAREIVESKRAVEGQLQTPALHFAYPNGTYEDFNDTTIQLVKEAGFQSAVTTVFGVNTAATDRFALFRGGPWEAETPRFAAKLWWYRWMAADQPGARPATSSGHPSTSSG